MLGLVQRSRSAEVAFKPGNRLFMLKKSAHACVNVYLNKLPKCLWAVVSQETATLGLCYSCIHDCFSKSTVKITSVCLADNLMLALDPVVNCVTAKSGREGTAQRLLFTLLIK